LHNAIDSQNALVFDMRSAPEGLRKSLLHKHLQECSGTD